MEATSERSFMWAVNERECARSSEWQRRNGPNSAVVHQGYLQLTTRLLSTPETFVVPQNVSHHSSVFYSLHLL